MNYFLQCVEAFALVSALSIDAFLASFAYGTNSIKIPLKSIAMINLVCSSVLGFSLFIGNLIGDFIPQTVTSYLCFAILFLISLAKLFDFVIKRWIEKQNCYSPKTEFKILNFRFCLQLIADPIQADRDSSLVLSCKEAIALGVSLSLDGFAVGIGAGMVATNHIELFFFSLITGIIAVLLGYKLGNILTRKSQINLSWLSGVILMILAFTKII